MLDLPWQWIISLGLQVLGMIGGAIGVYYKMRELIYSLHNENKIEIHKLQMQHTAIKEDIDDLKEWWKNHLERRQR